MPRHFSWLFGAGFYFETAETKFWIDYQAYMARKGLHADCFGPEEVPKQVDDFTKKATGMLMYYLCRVIAVHIKLVKVREAALKYFK